MSSASRRSSRPRQPPTADQERIRDLVAQLRALLPDAHLRAASDTASTAKVLEEACDCIRRLQREVDDLCEQLSESLAALEPGGAAPSCH